MQGFPCQIQPPQTQKKNIPQKNQKTNREKTIKKNYRAAFASWAQSSALFPGQIKDLGLIAKDI
jgi:hypothetical protein